MALLEVRELTKTFGGLYAVNDISFDVEKGSIYGIIGPNGAGKTTIFNLITGIYSITSGIIVFNGHNIGNMETCNIARLGITRTFQNIRLFKKLTVYENILTACQSDASYTFGEAILFGSLPEKLKSKTRFGQKEKLLKLRSEELIDMMGLSDRKDIVANNLPYGLQRRLEIARALALNPKLLLLDEPAAGMNPDETGKLMELIREIRGKFDITVLLIEHHMDLVMGICEKILVMNFGCRLMEGTPIEVQNDERVMEAYLGGGASIA